jgi:tetratricopeptide (TPR) repeat protein
VAWGAATALVSGRRSPRALDRVALAIVVVVAVAAVAALDPVRRIEDFKNPLPNSSADFVRSHLLSSSGSGRWQFWEAAVDAFKDAPLTGQGAGAYEAWWAQHGSLAQFVRDAHSLYFESLAELGAPGALLVVLALGTGLYSLATRVFRADGESRVSVAAAGGAFVGFLFAAGIDWMWELTVVPCVGLVLLGLLTGPASAPLPRVGSATPAAVRPRPWRGSALAALVAGWGLMILLAIPLLAELQLGDSRAAAVRGRADEALKSATRASRIEPWAASPYLQIALIEEQAGRLRPARRSIHRAIDRSPTDWRLWLVDARIETKLGEIRSAKASFARARSLNPRSPIFSQAPT